MGVAEKRKALTHNTYIDLEVDVVRTKRTAHAAENTLYIRKPSKVAFYGRSKDKDEEKENFRMVGWN